MVAQEGADGTAEDGLLLEAPDERTPHLTAVDWTGLPARVASCLTRRKALELLDWQPRRGGPGGRALQEEYVEWRTVRSEAGVERVELTSEPGERWRTLAAHEPRRTLDLVARMARQPQVPVEGVYRGCDPFDERVTPAARARAFEAAMLADSDPSPYNDGRAAICCMVQPTNTLDALRTLARAATTARVTLDALDGRARCLTCDECSPFVGSAAQMGRASDPVLVERLARLAYEGRPVAFDDPVGVYIQSVERDRLRTPDGTVVPETWFRFERPAVDPPRPDGYPRWQRLTVEPPEGCDLRVGDLVDAATEQPIRHGGQIADLVQLVVLLRVGRPDPGHAQGLTPTELVEPDGDGLGCDSLERILRRFEADRA